MKNAHKWGVNPNLNPDYPAVDEEHECHIAKQYLELWGGWFGVIMSIPFLVAFVVVLYAIVLDGLNFYL